MPFICEVNDKTLEYMIEILPNQGLFSESTLDLLKKSITVTAKIKQNYDNCIRTDKKILGRGRTSLLEGLDYLFTHLAVLQLSFSDKIQAMGDQGKFKVLLKKSINKILSEGVFAEDKVAAVTGFGIDFEKHIVEKMKVLLVTYNQAFHEKGKSYDDIVLTLDEILHQCLVIRYKLKNCLIDT